MLLARQKDERSLQFITEAVEGVRDAQEACSIIKALVGWGDIRLVPGLLSFLRNGESAGFYGDDLFIPALKAREALYLMTGHYFAFEVGSSKRAWEAAEHIADREELKRRLDALQPEDPFPLRADLVGNGTTKAIIRVQNKSKRPVVVARYPGRGTQKWPGGVASCGMGSTKDRGKSSFVTLSPASSTEFPIRLHEAYLLAEPGTRELTLAYTDNGSSQDVNAWIGLVNVHFAEAPK